MKSFTFTDFFYRSTLYVALAVALTATLGSLYFSEVRLYLPCNLCWYQRILMYPLVIVLAVGLLRRDMNLPYYVLPLSLFGQGIATYHYLLEKTNIFAAPTACQVGIPCTTPWINWAGFITIPFLAMSAFFMITIFCLIAMIAGEPEAEEFSSPPWFQVAAVCAIVVAAFVGIYRYDPLRANSLTLTVPAVGEMSPVAASEDSAANADVIPTVQPSLAAPGTAMTTEAGAAASQADSAMIALGQQLYVANCSVCHGPDAQGAPNIGTSLAGSPIIHSSDEEALAFIRTGRAMDDPSNTTGLPMPPDGAHPELADSEMLAIIAFLRAQ